MAMQINFGNTAFAVPGAVVDHFIRLAGENELKVLLYLLRRADANLSAAQIGEYLHITPEQAEDALQFWVQADVLRTDHAAAAPAFAFAVQPPAPAVQPAPIAAAPQAAAEPVSPVGAQRSSKEIKLDPSEIASEIEQSPILSDLFALAEKRIGKPLNHMEQRSLLWLHEYLNVPSEVILMLLEYCISIGKYSISYAESIAIRWQTDGILSLEQAEAEIRRMTREHTFITDIQKRFEMKRTPTARQRGYLELWQKANYPMELIQFAYEITIENIEKLDFKYINTILEGWAASGIRDLAAAQAERSKPRTQKTSGRKSQPISQQEFDEMNDYLSVVNRFKGDETT